MLFYLLRSQTADEGVPHKVIVDCTHLEQRIEYADNSVDVDTLMSNVGRMCWMNKRHNKLLKRATFTMDRRMNDRRQYRRSVTIHLHKVRKAVFHVRHKESS